MGPQARHCCRTTRQAQPLKMRFASHTMAMSANAFNPEAVAIFTTPGCKYCRKAKDALSTAEICFTEIDVGQSTGLRSALTALTGIRTVPQVFLDSKFFGGSDEVVAALADGSFARLVKSAKDPPLPIQLSKMVDEYLAEAEKAHRSDAATDNAASTLGAALEAARFAGKSLGHAFSGQQLLAWLLEESPPDVRPASEEAARQLAQRLLDANVVTCTTARGPGNAPPAACGLFADKELRYRLRSRSQRPRRGQALNTHYTWCGAARPAAQVSEDLRGRILALYDRHLSADGRAVNYSAMREDPLFWQYVDATAELQQVDVVSLSRTELLAAFINLYNALIVHALVVHGTNMSGWWQRLQLFGNLAKYDIGGHTYTADDIEHGVLRANSPTAIAALLPGPLRRPPFGPHDPRANAVVRPLDPRIHFALVCGAKSCPPIRLYSADDVEEGLAGAAEAFCSTEVVVQPDSRKVVMSSILKWYGKDFGDNEGQMLRTLLPMLPREQRAGVSDLLASGEYVVEYKPYNWDVNASA